MKSPNWMFLVLSNVWVKQSGVATLVEQEDMNSEGDIAFLDCESVDTSDGTFVVAKVFTPALSGHWVRLHIPKQVIYTIVEAESPDDATKMGFKMKHAK